MCTAISFKTNHHYFGRNLDYEFSYHETVTITPRNYAFNFLEKGVNSHHFAMIGMAYVVNDYPLYYDATNEHGLSMAGLNFPSNAYYFPKKDGYDNITPFEFIPWILCQCKTTSDAQKLLEKLNLVKINFSDSLPLSPLHWMISDAEKSIVVESVKDGLKIYDNDFKVLTNNPPFPYHALNVTNYMSLTHKDPQNSFAEDLKLTTYSRGMGTLGLPGDYSSSSRFVKAVFVLHNSKCASDENASVNQFFHILDAVSQHKGCVAVGEKFEYTIYSSCCNTDLGIYYYTTYENQQPNAVSLFNENLDSNKLINYQLNDKMIVNHQN